MSLWHDCVSFCVVALDPFVVRSCRIHKISTAVAAWLWPLTRDLENLPTIPTHEYLASFIEIPPLNKGILCHTKIGVNEWRDNGQIARWQTKNQMPLPPIVSCRDTKTELKRTQKMFTCISVQVINTKCNANIWLTAILAVAVIVQPVRSRIENCCLLKDLWVSSAVWVESDGWVWANVLVLTEWFVSLTVDLCHLHSCHVLHRLHTSSHTHRHAYSVTRFLFSLAVYEPKTFYCALRLTC